MDITREGATADAAGRHGASTIIHLAALQIPFYAADPVIGAAVSVVGHAHALETARQAGIRNVVHASSVASLPGPGSTMIPAVLTTVGWFA
ncbi:MAG: NAD-dependent epimerase/dehydratase family protein [Rhodospirillaceae bacterium]|nr:NAD-dependent epimerase/dehydratase family protein [Rhodospirillaceae bacterium]